LARVPNSDDLLRVGDRLTLDLGALGLSCGSWGLFDARRTVLLQKPELTIKAINKAAMNSRRLMAIDPERAG
jgi:hypothetical protein